MSNELVCRLCAIPDKPRRRVIKIMPQEDITDGTPTIIQEMLCKNKIMVKHPCGRDAEGKIIHAWYEEGCNNHMLRVGMMAVKN